MYIKYYVFNDISLYVQSFKNFKVVPTNYYNEL